MRFQRRVLSAAGLLTASCLCAPHASRAQNQPITFIAGPISRVIAGTTLPSITVQVPSAGAGVLVQAIVHPGFALAPAGDSAVTDANGRAIFSKLALWGPVGNASLIFVAGNAVSPEVQLSIVPGQPRFIVVDNEPSPTAAAETLIVRGARIRVSDLGGNDVPGISVAVRPLARTGTVDTSHFSVGSVISGQTSAETDANGIAQFDSLKIVGPSGSYRLQYVVRYQKAGGGSDSAMTWSQTIRHNPDRNSNQSFVVVSAIKTISGVAPKNEFFDLRFRFRFSQNLFGLGQVDFGLSGTGDSVHSTQHELTEAAVSLNKVVWTYKDLEIGRVERALYVGPTLVVFNTLPYVGIQFGSIEHAGSAFQGSSMQVAVLSRLSPDTNFVGGDTLFAAKQNLYASFFVRSSTIAFFKALNLRGGVVLPFDFGHLKGGRLSTRLVVSVPVGSIDFF